MTPKNPVQLLVDAQDYAKGILDELVQVNEGFYLAERKYNIAKNTIMNLESVQHLPNQTMRDAEMENILENDDRYRPMLEEYGLLKIKRSKLWAQWDYAKMACENQRAIVNNFTFGGKE